MSVPCWLMNTIRFVFTPGGSKAEHFQNQDLVDAALMLHTMRLDGTPAGRGILRTRPLRILGDDLRINVKTSYGRVRVRILNESGQTIPGFGFRDCIPLTGDELFWTPRWQGGRTMGEKPRQLEIELITGEIFKCWYHQNNSRKGGRNQG
ncbi:MAG: hypothetical protein M0Q40_06585 [Limnochordia bacterium]|nr:hypothetical protein [Limnochordia bacterium]